VNSVFTVNGFNFAGRGQSSGMAFIMLRPWHERNADNSVFKVAARAQQHFFTFRDAMVFAFAPPCWNWVTPPVSTCSCKDRAGIGHEKLMEARNQFLGMAAQSKVLSQVRPNGLNDEPQYQLKSMTRRPAPWASPSPTSTTPCRLPWAVATSTTSSTAVG
jgi:multidrug efflux pump